MTEHRSSSQRSRDDRTPPHSIEAEESVLACAMLQLDAAETMIATLDVSDFWRPAHQHIAAAIFELFDSDRPVVDIVTVSDRLRHRGLLDTIGGVQTLIGMVAATPAITSAHRYATIVRDAAVLRRLIHTGAEIAEIGYSAGDPSVAVTRAGEILNRVSVADAEVLSTLDQANIAQLLAGDLAPEEPTILRRSDGGSLLYPGKLHSLQAEPSSGKSWVALYAVAEVLDLGGAAGYLDYEDTPTGCLSRMRALRCNEQAMRDRFYYARPEGRFGPAERIEFGKVCERMNFDLVVIDGVGESLAREGLSEDKAEDFLRWADILPRMIARTGAAVLMIDHVAKDPEQRGRWARGTGAKLAVNDGATYQLKVRQAFSRRRAGRVDLVIAKDRPGGVGPIGDTAATIHIEPAADGEIVSVRIEPHSADVAPTDSWKPTVIMGKVWQALHDSQAPLTATGLAALVHSDKPRLVKEAIARLIAEGFIAETGKRPKMLRIVKPYTDAPQLAAPPWREPPPPPELFDEAPYLTDDELAEIDRQRFETDPRFFNNPEF